MHRTEPATSRCVPHTTGLVIGTVAVGIAATFFLQVIGSTSYWGATEVVGVRTDENRDSIAQHQLGLYFLTAIYALAQLADQVRQERDTSAIAIRGHSFQRVPGLANAVSGFFSGFIDGAVRPAAAVYAIAHPSTNPQTLPLFS